MIKVKHQDLEQCVFEIFVALGESKENAKVVTESLVCSDCRGVTTHGTYYLFPIMDRIRASQFDLPSSPKVIVDNSAIAVIDGGNGFGQIAGKLAVDVAIKHASEYGISLVMIRNTNNLGALAFYTDMIAREKMIGIMGCNAAPAMAPWGGAEAFIGSNPIAIAFHTGRDLIFSADMATSVVARGKIRKAVMKGQTIPNDWALDANGNPTTDPAAALKGTLLPMGGPKGSAIALAIDIFSGILSGAKYGPNIKSFHEPNGPTGIGAMLMAIDIQKFMEVSKFTTTMDEYIHTLKNGKKSIENSEIFIPGEIEHRNEVESKANGVRLEEKTFDNINKVLKELKIDRALESIE